MTKSRLQPARILFPLVLLMFILKSLLYIAVTPLWEGFDELFHFAYVQSLAATRTLPVWGETFIDSEIAESTAYLPLAGLMPQLAPGSEKLSYQDYWKMKEPKRDELERKLRRLTASAKSFVSSDVSLYQTQHPPLYYALCVPLYRLMDDRNIVDKAYALRIFSALLASLCVVAVALKAKDNESQLNAMLAGLVALWPCLYIDIARVGNDSLGIAIFSFLFLGMMRYGEEPSARRGVALGALLGLGLLTKAYFLTAIPAIVLFLVLLALRNREKKRGILRDLCFVLIVAGAVGGWWYLRNFHLYGTFSGLQETMHVPSVGVVERVQAVLEVSWVLVVKYLFVTYCWVSGWSFLHLPKPMYLVFIALFGAAAVGLARTTFAGKKKELASATERTASMAAVCLLAFFALGVAYHEVNAYATVRYIGGPGGWYLYALVVPISFLVSLGVGEAWPKLARAGFLMVFAAIMMVELYGFLLVLAPYYAGVAIPAADGWGVSFGGATMSVFSAETFARLTANKPHAFSSAVLLLLGVACYVVQIAVLWSVAACTEDASSLPESTS